MLFSRETRKKLSALRRRPKADTPDRDASVGASEAIETGDETPRPDTAPAPEAPADAKPSEGVLTGLTRERLQAKIEAQRERHADAPDAASSADAVAADLADESAYSRAPPGAPVPVDALFPGEAVTRPFGACYVMRPEVEGLCDWGATVGEALSGFLTTGKQWADDALASAFDRGDLTFLDIETAGLSAMPVFLVGVLRYTGGRLEITQILARDYPEEAPLLEETAAALRGSSLLFTYNGATFDMPYLQERAIYHAVDWEVDTEHVDLLKPARKRFRGTFPDCKLQTLETLLCGRERGDDIPGAQIPRTYQEFVRTQDARLLESIVRHNQIDLLTLAEILPHCLGDVPD